MPGGDVADSEVERVEECADRGQADGLHVALWPEVGIGFFGVLGDGFEAGEEIRNDLQREKDGEIGTRLENGMEVCRGAADGADGDEGDKNNEDHGGHGFLEDGAETDAAVVDCGEKQSESDAEEEAGEKDGLAGDAIEDETIQRRKNVGSDFADGDGFPGADDEVSEKHHPAGEIADDGRKDLRGVGSFAGGIGETLDPLAVNVANGEKDDAANGEAESSA